MEYSPEILAQWKRDGEMLRDEEARFSEDCALRIAITEAEERIEKRVEIQRLAETFISQLEPQPSLLQDITLVRVKHGTIKQRTKKASELRKWRQWAIPLLQRERGKNGACIVTAKTRQEIKDVINALSQSQADLGYSK